MPFNLDDLKSMQNDIDTYLALACPDFKARTAIILGSGLSKLSDALTVHAKLPYHDIPHVQSCSVSGHAGNLILGTLHEQPIICFQGRLHWYEGADPIQFHPVCLLMKTLGVEQVIITNASGAINPSIQPGDLVLVEDHINFQFKSPLLGLIDSSNQQFLDLHQAYDVALNQQIKQTAKHLNINLKTGVYIGVLGPNFETPAEIRAYGILGADLIGMSTLPEVITANYYGFKVAVIAIISNMAAGLCHETLSHELTLRIAEQGADKLITLIKTLLYQDLTTNCHSS